MGVEISMWTRLPVDSQVKTTLLYFTEPEALVTESSSLPW